MDILSLVSDAKEKKASDLHVSENSPPMLRINGEIGWSDGDNILTSSDIKAFLEEVTTPEEPQITAALGAAIFAKEHAQS